LPGSALTLKPDGTKSFVRDNDEAKINAYVGSRAEFEAVDDWSTFWASGIVVSRINPARRLRADPRVVKRKVLKWAAKRECHQHHPQPTQSSICTILSH
jgi:hypothetical protein